MKSQAKKNRGWSLEEKEEKKEGSAYVRPRIDSTQTFIPVSSDHHTGRTMKVQFKNWQAVAAWRWDIKTDTSDQPPHPTYNNGGDDDDEEEEEEEEDVCGICRLAFDSTCPECKIPGDDCPLMWGQCTHVFHMHCVLKWLDTESSKNQCPMDRRPWVTAERNDPASSPMADSPPPSPPPQHHPALQPLPRERQHQQDHHYQQQMDEQQSPHRQ